VIQELFINFLVVWENDTQSILKMKFKKELKLL